MLGSINSGTEPREDKPYTLLDMPEEAWGPKGCAVVAHGDAIAVVKHCGLHMAQILDVVSRRHLDWEEVEECIGLTALCLAARGYKGMLIVRPSEKPQDEDLEGLGMTRLGDTDSGSAVFYRRLPQEVAL